MANYIYSTFLFKAGADVINMPVDNAVHLADFEDNHKLIAQDISDIVIQELTFTIDVDYDTFEGFIDGDITWAEVKYIDKPDKCELYIVTVSPL